MRALLCVAALLAALGPATAQQLRRATIWNLKLGEPIAAQPSPDEFRGFACGSNGGAPRQPLTGWRDFARCSAGQKMCALHGFASVIWNSIQDRRPRNGEIALFHLPRKNMRSWNSWSETRIA